MSNSKVARFEGILRAVDKDLMTLTIFFVSYECLLLLRLRKVMGPSAIIVHALGSYPGVIVRKLILRLSRIHFLRVCRTPAARSAIQSYLDGFILMKLLLRNICLAS